MATNINNYFIFNSYDRDIDHDYKLLIEKEIEKVLSRASLHSGER